MWHGCKERYCADGISASPKASTFRTHPIATVAMSLQSLMKRVKCKEVKYQETTLRKRALVHVMCYVTLIDY